MAALHVLGFAVLQELTVEMIRSGHLIESSTCDFKGRLDLDDLRAKTNLINDVVAFLNMGAGRLVIGVHEKRGAFNSFEPIQAQKDEYSRRLLSTIQDNIDPKPLRVEVGFLDLDNGFLADIVMMVAQTAAFSSAMIGLFILMLSTQLHLRAATVYSFLSLKRLLPDTFETSNISSITPTY